MNVRVLLLASPGEACDVYRKELGEMGVEYDVMSSFSDYFKVVPLRTYNGLLFDVSSLVRLDAAERTLAHDLINIFPSLRLKWDPREQKIRTLFYGMSTGKDPTLQKFLLDVCRPFPRRAFRSSDRIPRNLNVLLSTTTDFSDVSVLRTFTANVSLHGAFIVSIEPWEMMSRIWVRFLEMDDDTPIEAEVRWSIEWGKAMCVPGIGVRFVRMTDLQSEELALLSRGVRKHGQETG